MGIFLTVSAASGCGLVLGIEEIEKPDASVNASDGSTCVGDGSCTPAQVEVFDGGESCIGDGPCTLRCDAVDDGVHQGDAGDAGAAICVATCGAGPCTVYGSGTFLVNCPAGRDCHALCGKCSMDLAPGGTYAVTCESNACQCLIESFGLTNACSCTAPVVTKTLAISCIGTW